MGIKSLYPGSKIFWKPTQRNGACWSCRLISSSVTPQNFTKRERWQRMISYNTDNHKNLPAESNLKSSPFQYKSNSMRKILLPSMFLSIKINFTQTKRKIHSKKHFLRYFGNHNETKEMILILVILCDCFSSPEVEMCGFESKVFTTIGQITSKFSTDIHIPLKLINHFGDPPMFVLTRYL